ncbi:hypothetical protein FGB62_37g416 [Gracilaria domingensis]|nr:hypothetical protein FGB62_37g416 [Gracilaria domingensis]
MSLTHVHAQALYVLVGRERINRDHIFWASTWPQPDHRGLDSRFRTDELREDQDENVQGHIKLLWACEYCGNSYDFRGIEMELMEIAQKLYTAYYVQDLICGDGPMLKRENMTSQCNSERANGEQAHRRDWVTPGSCECRSARTADEAAADLTRFAAAMSAAAAWPTAAAAAPRLA